jgi:hypothetical protein
LRSCSVLIYFVVVIDDVVVDPSPVHNDIADEDESN